MSVCQRPLPRVTVALRAVLLTTMALGVKAERPRMTTQNLESALLTSVGHTELPGDVEEITMHVPDGEKYDEGSRPPTSVGTDTPLRNGSNSRAQCNGTDGLLTEGRRPPEVVAEEEEEEEDRQECPQLGSSQLVRVGFQRATALGLEHCARLWCSHVQVSEERQHLDGVYHVVQLGHVAEYQHVCLLNLTKMVVLHHSWPMCFSDFICATNHSTFDMSASDCMPLRCLVAETVVLVFMVLVSACIIAMSLVIMVVIVVYQQFHKPKYYLRFSLAASDFLIGVTVCGHAAYNQWVGLTEIPSKRFSNYANLKAEQLFRHVPNCLWGVSDVFTQISGFFVTANMIISFYTLSLMSLDRYLLLTRTHYRALVTSRRVAAALVVSWCCGLVVPSLHFVYRPQRQRDICVNYDTSPLDVHIINNESKFATADYKVYLRHAVPLAVTLVVIGLPIVALLVFSFRALRRHHAYTRERSVRQVKSALQLTRNHRSVSRQVSANSLSAPPPHRCPFRSGGSGEGRIRGPKTRGPSAPPLQEGAASEDLSPSLAGMLTAKAAANGSSAALAPSGEGAAAKSRRGSLLGAIGLRRAPPATHSGGSHQVVVAAVRRIRGNAREAGELVTVRERDREITCTVLVNVAVFVFACFPLLGVGCWMMFLYFTQQEAINNPAPLKQLLFVTPWLMALNSLWNAVLHLSYNHKFRSAARHMIWSGCRKLWQVCTRRTRLQE